MRGFYRRPLLHSNHRIFFRLSQLMSLQQPFKLKNTGKLTMNKYVSIVNTRTLKKILLRHIHNALEDEYIEHLVNYDTCLIEDNIPTVLNSLFTSYGNIQSKEVKIKEVDILNLRFNPAYSMITHL